MHDIKTKQYISSIKNKDDKGNLKHFIKETTIKDITSRKDQKEESANTTAANQITTAAKTTFKESSYRTIKEFKRFKIHKNEPQPQKITYISRAKQYVTKKIQSIPITHTAPFHTVQETVNYTVKAVRITKKAVSSFIGAGTGLLLLIVMTLFIGTFSVLAQDSGVNSTITNLSDEVIAYAETIQKYADMYGIGEYTALIQAVMMQESKGLGNDPMQASESVYNTAYPDGITDPEYSIDCGVHTLADCIHTAEVTSTADTEHIYLALQGYDYGTEYITWAITNFGGYSRYNAKLYSDNKKKELNTDTYGDPEYVDHVMQYVSFTFRGGTNPNFNNSDAWITKNPYAQSGLYGQCTWFAWGRFYELYGYSPGFTGNGWDCVNELLKAHPDQFERSSSPIAGAVFSGIGVNHVGIVIAVDGDDITIQEGNLDGITNTFQDAKKDWHTVTYTLEQLRSTYRGVVFANPK